MQESGRTTPIAARVENELVAEIRRYAWNHHTTVSATVAGLIRSGVPALRQSPQQASFDA